MTHRGKSGKLQKQKRVSHAFLRAWKSGEKQKRRIPTFPQRRRRRAGSESEGRRKNTKPDRSLAKKSGHLDVLRTAKSDCNETKTSHNAFVSSRPSPSFITFRS